MGINIRKKSFPFQSKLLITLICTSIIIACYIGFISYGLATEKVLDMSIKLSENNADATADRVENYITRFNSWTTHITRLPELRALAGDEQLSSAQLKNTSMTIQNLVDSASADGIELAQINVYFTNGQSYLFTDSYEYPYHNFDSCVSYCQELGLSDSDYANPAWLSSVPLKRKTGELCSGLLHARFLYDPVTMEKIGIMVSGVYEDILCDSYTELSDKAFIIDRNGIVLSSHNKSSIGILCKNKSILGLLPSTINNYASATYKNQNNNSVLVSFRPVMGNAACLVSTFDFYSNLRKQEMKSYIQSLLLLIVAGILGSVIISTFLSRTLSRSIRSLTKFLKSVYSGNTGERFKTNSYDEVAYLGARVNDMLDRIQRSEKDREADMKANQLLEFQLMQSQINPHLLYNTLDSMLWTLSQKRIDDATKLLTSLSEFFKRTLSGGKAMVPLSSELDTIRHYLNIQRLARQQNISLICNIDPISLNYPIIKLILQPIVENSIIHGFSGYRNDGTIKINVVLNYGVLELTVTDNGIGLLPDKIDAINSYLHLYPPPQNICSFGLYNVHRRIIQTYGESFGVRIDSAISEYTCVTLTLPYKEELQND